MVGVLAQGLQLLQLGANEPTISYSLLHELDLLLAIGIFYAQLVNLEGDLVLERLVKGADPVVSLQPAQDPRLVVPDAPDGLLAVVDVRLRQVQPAEQQLHVGAQGHLVHAGAHHQRELPVLVVVEVPLQEHLLDQPRA